MIKFFRSIRQNLLQNGKLKSYSIYAIGEIFLLVIGILIALQINNWNEFRKSAIQEAAFFTDVLGDLEKDSIKLDYIFDFHSKRIEYLDTLLTYVRNSDKLMGLEKFGMHVEPLYYEEAATNYSTSFESAKTSGAFNSFKNKTLLKDLTEYYTNFILLENNINSISNIITDQFEPLMSSLPLGYLNPITGSKVISENSNKMFYEKLASIKDNRSIDIDYNKLLQDPRFESYIVGDMGRTFNLLTKIKSRQQHLENIKHKILTKK
ncbi:MAG: hypothetical protein IPL55_13740 [Saprospiraceae bacterium]|nr:hypothetical protein [Saprospiraceae bacterium]